MYKNTHWHTLEWIYTKKYPRGMHHHFNVLSRFHFCCKPTVPVNILLLTCSTRTFSLYLAEGKIVERHKTTLTSCNHLSSNYYWKNQHHMIHRHDSDTPHSANWRNNWKSARIKLSLTPALKGSFSNTHGSRYTIYVRIKWNGNTFKNAGML